MNKAIESLRSTRLHLLELVKDLSIEQLNEIPDGFNNNIIWNLGHLVVAQQSLCYMRAGVQPRVGENYFNNFKPGTKPEFYFDEAAVQDIKDLLISVIGKLAADYNDNLFSNYSTFTSAFGVELTNIDDALGFVLFHDGLHTGYIMAMKHALK